MSLYVLLTATLPNLSTCRFIESVKETERQRVSVSLNVIVLACVAGRESELERNGVRLGKKDRERKRKKCIRLRKRRQSTKKEVICACVRDRQGERERSVCVRERRRSIIKTLDSVCNKDGRRVVIRISSIVFRLFMSLLCVTLN